jgi:hypothetical protein
MGVQLEHLPKHEADMSKVQADADGVDGKIMVGAQPIPLHDICDVSTQPTYTAVSSWAFEYEASQEQTWLTGEEVPAPPQSRRRLLEHSTSTQTSTHDHARCKRAYAAQTPSRSEYHRPTHRRSLSDSVLYDSMQAQPCATEICIVEDNAALSKVHATCETNVTKPKKVRRRGHRRALSDGQVPRPADLMLGTHEHKHGKLPADDILAAHMKMSFMFTAKLEDTRTTEMHTAEIDNCDTLSESSDVETKDTIFESPTKKTLQLLDTIVAKHF